MLDNELLRPIYSHAGEKGKARHIVGHIDRIGPNGVCGWAASSNGDTSPLLVTVRLAGRVVASGETLIHRVDVEEHLGFHVSAGFFISFTETRRLTNTLLRDTPIPSGEPENIQLRVIVEVNVKESGEVEEWMFSIPDGVPVVRSRSEWLAYFDIDRTDTAGGTLFHLSDTGLTPVPNGGPSSPAFIAFYLPQFHPFSENDSWWGPGFTEWTGVSTLQPQFEGHVAPNIPADLGFYDLRLREVRQRQTELAKAFGIYGFCYYFYWFSGQRLMFEPLRLILRERSPDMPFCLCWANEPWSRRWDGSEAEVLMAQNHDVATDVGIINELATFFEDDRYIRIDGRPLFVIYRLGLMPAPGDFTREMRRVAKEIGFPDLFICNVMSFGDGDARTWGCDAAVEFPPHNFNVSPYDRSRLSVPASFSGEIFDYADLVVKYAIRKEHNFPYFPGVMPRWDNTARKREAGNVYQGSTPALFATWLRIAAVNTMKRNPGSPLVFINSWNEWGEGAHLEPDRRFGRRYLEAVRRVALAAYDAKGSVNLRDSVWADLSVEAEKGLDNQELELVWLARRLQDFSSLTGPDPVFVGFPDPLRYGPPVVDGGCANIDNMNGVYSPQVVFTRRSKGVHARGWFVGDAAIGVPKDSFGYMLLDRLDLALSYYAPVLERGLRKDVAEQFGFSEEMGYANFDVRLDLAPVEPGTYTISFVEVCDGRSTRIKTDAQLVVA